uniref:Uncharacterized protein n=1 Tax=Arundo donax TaxID=35708 RepID=A0A0A9A0B6_ARUDO
MYSASIGKYDMKA